jgi:hypothetical protein
LERHRECQQWQDYRTGLICAVLANINRDPKKSKPFTPQDFMPGQAQRKQEKQTPEQMIEVVKIYQKYFEAKEKKDARR